MDPVTLGIGALVALFVLSRRPAPAAQPPAEQPASPPSGPAGGGDGGAGSVAALVPAGAAALAFGAAGGALGKAITGDDAGYVVGFVNPIAGNAFNAGREVGEHLDVQLGGDGKSGTGIVAQVGVGGGLALAVILGPLFALFAVTYVVNLIIVYAVGSIISDTGRLAYGQKGAEADYRKAWAAIHGKIYTVLRERGLTDAQALRVSYPYADGYMRAMNRIAYRQWMKRGRGLFGLGNISDRDHAKFGEARGYFVGAADGGAELLVEPPALSQTDPEYWLKAEFAEGDLIEKSVTEVEKYVTDWQDDPSKFRLANTPPDFFPEIWGYKAADGKIYSSMCQLWKDQGKADPQSLDYKLLYQPKCMMQVQTPLYRTRSYKVDRFQGVYFAIAAAQANAAAYLQWMAQARGAFVSDEKHAQYGVDEGRFEGAVISGGKGAVDVQWATTNPDGGLRIETRRLDWTQKNGGIS